MYAKRVTEAVELAKARAGAIMVRTASAAPAPAPSDNEAARRELAVAEAGEPAKRGG